MYIPFNMHTLEYIIGIIILLIIIPSLLYILLKKVLKCSTLQFWGGISLYLGLMFLNVYLKYKKLLSTLPEDNFDCNYTIKAFSFDFFEASLSHLGLVLFTALIIFSIKLFTWDRMKTSIYATLIMYIIIIWVIGETSLDVTDPLTLEKICLNSCTWATGMYKFTTASLCVIVPFLMTYEHCEISIYKIIHRVVFFLTLRSFLTPAIIFLFTYFSINTFEVINSIFLFIFDPIITIIPVNICLLPFMVILYTIITNFFNNIVEKSLSYIDVNFTFDSVNLIKNLNFNINLDMLYVKVPILDFKIPTFSIKPYTPEILYKNITNFYKNILSLISEYNFSYMYIDGIEIKNLEAKCLETSKPLINTTLLMDNPNASGSNANNLRVNIPEVGDPMDIDDNIDNYLNPVWWKSFHDFFKNSESILKNSYYFQRDAANLVSPYENPFEVETLDPVGNEIVIEDMLNYCKASYKYLLNGLVNSRGEECNTTCNQDNILKRVFNKLEELPFIYKNPNPLLNVDALFLNNYYSEIDLRQNIHNELPNPIILGGQSPVWRDRLMNYIRLYSILDVPFEHDPEGSTSFLYRAKNVLKENNVVSNYIKGYTGISVEPKFFIPEDISDNFVEEIRIIIKAELSFWTRFLKEKQFVNVSDLASIHTGLSVIIWNMFTNSTPAGVFNMLRVTIPFIKDLCVELNAFSYETFNYTPGDDLNLIQWLNDRKMVYLQSHETSTAMCAIDGILEIENRVIESYIKLAIDLASTYPTIEYPIWLTEIYTDPSLSIDQIYSLTTYAQDDWQGVVAPYKEKIYLIQSFRNPKIYYNANQIQIQNTVFNDKTNSIDDDITVISESQVSTRLDLPLPEKEFYNAHDRSRDTGRAKWYDTVLDSIRDGFTWKGPFHTFRSNAERNIDLFYRLEHLIKGEGHVTNFSNRAFCNHNENSVYRNESLVSLNFRGVEAYTQESFTEVITQATKFFKDSKDVCFSDIYKIFALLRTQFIYVLTENKPLYVHQKLDHILPYLNKLNYEIQQYEKTNIFKCKNSKLDSDILRKKTIYLEGRPEKSAITILKQIQFIRDYGYKLNNRLIADPTLNDGLWFIPDRY